jgi:protein-S-isoprenylcysteine O-methyltransferase Ste14
LFIGLIFGPALYYRMKWEESALVQKFGEPYRQYQQNTPALFPYKIPQAK